MVEDVALNTRSVAENLCVGSRMQDRISYKQIALVEGEVLVDFLWMSDW